MNILETLRVSIQSLGANKMRSFLSMLGIIIGVAAVVTTVSIGSGAQESITSQISALGSNLINITLGFTRGRAGRVSREAREIFTLEMGEQLEEACPSLKAVIPTIRNGGRLVYKNTNVQASLIGADNSYMSIFNYKLAAGRFISEEDLEGSRLVIVLGSQLVNDLFEGEDPLEEENPLGKKIKVTVGSRWFMLTVIGIMEEKGQVMFSNYDNQAYVPITTAMNRFTTRDFVDGYSAEAISAEAAEDAVAQIEFFLTRKIGDPDKFNVFSQQEILDTVSQAMSTFSILLGGIASIALLVGGIGIMNIMLVSVTERTREIGIRKALGAKNKDILGQFMIEAFTLSTSGGIVGLLLGWGGAAMVARIGGWPLVVSPISVILAFAFSSGVGLTFGIYPAMKAARLDPVEALRYE